MLNFLTVRILAPGLSDSILSWSHFHPFLPISPSLTPSALFLSSRKLIVFAPPHRKLHLCMWRSLWKILRVPSNLVAMVSRNVFCGARRPFRPGIFLSALYLFRWGERLFLRFYSSRGASRRQEISLVFASSTHHSLTVRNDHGADEPQAAGNLKWWEKRRQSL